MSDKLNNSSEQNHISSPLTPAVSKSLTLQKNNPIIFWNRKKKCEEIEQVYGGAAVQWVYGTIPGQTFADRVLSRPFLSRVYGLYQNSRLSRHKIQPFIQNFSIPMDEFEDKKYRSFNDFFIRKFRPTKRPFVQNSNEFPAFSEARYFAYDSVLPSMKFPVKGAGLSPKGLLGNSEIAKEFDGGPLLLARLCPTDYHRFHFPDDGTVLRTYKIHGLLHSVNPLALQYNSDIFITNERQVSLLDTRNFGLLAHIEVGALCVGKIVQSQPGRKDFKRGDEKGYFLFGGSTVIVLGQKGRWKPDEDLLFQTSQNRETLIQLGEKIGSKI